MVCYESRLSKLFSWSFVQVPNPLFDLAGITCGHCLVPFWTFFGATLIGKAVIKMHIQVRASPSRLLISPLPFSPASPILPFSLFQFPLSYPPFPSLSSPFPPSLSFPSTSFPPFPCKEQAILIAHALPLRLVGKNQKNKTKS